MVIIVQHIAMQTNRMIWEIPLSDIDLIIFKNKKRRLLCLAIKKSISQTGILSNYIPMFFSLNNYIATPLITIQRTIRFIKIHGVYGKKIINIRGIVMLCFTTIHRRRPPTMKELSSRFTLLLFYQRTVICLTMPSGGLL